jgi:aspartate kinase
MLATAPQAFQARRLDRGVSAVKNSVEVLTAEPAESSATTESTDTHSAADMAVVVQKYGGTSLATVELIQLAAKRVADLAKAGRHVAVVVSAMGNTTDNLVALAERLAEKPDPRELDQMLATGEQVSAALFVLALAEHGVHAVSLTGDQAGIEVSGRHGAGVITRIDTARISDRLRRGQVVVVAGFQGRNAQDELLTLGRGGSDTTAVALAAALRANECAIYTDVSGVRTADPRVVSDTQPVPTVSYDAMAELSRSGAQVLHPRAVELAALRDVPVRVAHSSNQGPGTTVEAAERLESQHTVIGIAHEHDVQLVRLTAIHAGADRWAWALSHLIEQGLVLDAGFVLDALNGNSMQDGHFSLCFAVRGMVSVALEDVIRDVAEELGGDSAVDSDLGLVSIVGAGLLGRPDYVARMLRPLGRAGIPVRAMSTSNSRLTSVLPAKHVEQAVRTFHRTFGLHLPASSRDAWLDEPGNAPPE